MSKAHQTRAGGRWAQHQRSQEDAPPKPSPTSPRIKISKAVRQLRHQEMLAKHIERRSLSKKDHQHLVEEEYIQKQERNLPEHLRTAKYWRLKKRHGS